MFCKDSKLLVMEKMRRQFCVGPYGRFTIRLLLRSAATNNIRIYTVNSIQTGKCLGQNSAQKIVCVQSNRGSYLFVYSQTLEINLKR